MRHRKPARIALPLCDLRDLFTIPEFDPAAENSSQDNLAEPGIDYLTSLLQGRRLMGRAQLVLQLSPARVQAVAADRARYAIDRYCRHKILESKRALNELLWTGLKTLQVGVIFLATCLVLAAAIARSNAAPGSFGDVLIQGLTIVGWVSLWRPVEVFLYEWWPLWRQVRIYDYIQRMDIAVQTRT